MDARQFIEAYAKKNHADDPEWLKNLIWKKISSVGGLLSEEGAILLIAGEHGWAMQEAPMEAIKPKEDKTPITGYTELSDYYFDLIWDTTEKGNDYRKFPSEPLVVKILRIYDAKKPEYGFAKMQTGVKVTDGKNEKYFNFEDKEAFNYGEKTFPANLMSSAVQQVKQQLIGKTVAIYNWELGKYTGKDDKTKFSLTSTTFTYFKMVDATNFEAPMTESDIIDELYEEVPIQEIEEGI